MSATAARLLGLDPITGGWGPPGRTCGECAHRFRVRVESARGVRSYPKCGAWETGGPSGGLDVRASWPACDQFRGRDA